MKSFFATYKLQTGIMLVLVILLAVFMYFSPQTFLGKRIYIAFMSTIPFPPCWDWGSPC